MIELGSATLFKHSLAFEIPWVDMIFKELTSLRWQRKMLTEVPVLVISWIPKGSTVQYRK